LDTLAEIPANSTDRGYTMYDSTENSITFKRIDIKTGNEVNNERELYTLEFDWTPDENYTNSYLSIRTKTKEAFRHYIPDLVPGV
jgi:hypothetical protein